MTTDVLAPCVARHQQPWYWLYSVNDAVCSARKGRTCPHSSNVEQWYKTKRWVSARLQYLNCYRTGDTAVLKWPIEIYFVCLHETIQHVQVRNHCLTDVPFFSVYRNCGCSTHWELDKHYDDVTMSAIASQITSLTIVYSTVYSYPDQRKHQSAKCFTH